MDERTTDPSEGEDAPEPPVPRTGADGKPVYDQEFFLALARCGKDVWNRWRADNPSIRVTFEGVDFTEDTNGRDFSGFEFGRFANFSACRFGDRDRFLGDDFIPGMAKFTGAAFGISAKFLGATFGEGANLSDATFADWADFSSAALGDGSDLSGAIFGTGTKFSGATFGHDVKFDSATFKGFVDFSGNTTDVWKTRRSQLIESVPSFQSWPQARKDAFLTPPDDWVRNGIGPDAFSSISFSKARFFTRADLCDRKFRGPCVLTGARFDQLPIFDGSDRLDHLDLYGTRISFSGKRRITAGQYRFLVRLIPSFVHEVYRPPSRRTYELIAPGWTARSNVANQLRRLRGLAEITKNHDLERDLYVEERKAERGILLAQYWREGWRSLFKPKLYSHCLWIVVMATYSILAYYGRSFVRPLIALAVSVLLFWWAHATTLIPPIDPVKLENFHRATWAFAISNAVPFVGALTLERDVKLALLCGDRPIDAQHAQASGQPLCVPIPGRRFQLLALGQSIFSALCIFFAGLALRNYFKLR